MAKDLQQEDQASRWAGPLEKLASVPNPRIGTWPGTGVAEGVRDLDPNRHPGSETSEAADALRAIGAGEVDAFVVSGGELGVRVFSLATADRPYRMFVENMRDGAATVSASGLILYANQRLADLLGCPREALLGEPFVQYLAETPPLGWDGIRERTGAGVAIEYALLDAGSAIVPVLVGISPLEVSGDQLSCLTFTDLSVQKAQDREITRLHDAQSERMEELQTVQSALTRQATHDTLTGLPNRELLVDRIDQALAQAARSGRCTAVYFVDLDTFKQVNDTHGHATGDTVLKGVATLLTHALRSMDTVARIGGDEFAVLAHDVDSTMHAVDIGTRLVEALSHSARQGEYTERVTASVGISISVRGRGPAETLLEEADLAMYQAKSLGGDRAELFDSALSLLAHERLAGRRLLQSALDEHRIIAHYQPIVNLDGGAIAGFEALARIAAIDGAVVPPSAFIPTAEDTGLIVPLGEVVLRLACHEASGWRGSAAGPQLTVAVNLSWRQFERGDLNIRVGRSLESTGLPADRLHLELTETAVLDLQPEVLRQLRQIRDLGVEIGLDDFGTGYGSLTHLRRLPLSFVKIDRSFVSGLGTEPEDERIVAAVANLAANLNLRSIAEGVETEDQLRRLRDIGCDQAQGYLLARPMPAREILEALIKSQRAYC